MFGVKAQFPEQHQQKSVCCSLDGITTLANKININHTLE
jgi:hypothetical protein